LCNILTIYVSSCPPASKVAKPKVTKAEWGAALEKKKAFKKAAAT
jgi:hypothetical protein